MNTEQIKKLREYFENQGITQSQIAHDLDSSIQYINNMLSGRREFGRNTSRRFEEAYGISAAWLMTGEGEMMVSDRYNNAISKEILSQLPVNNNVILSLHKQIKDKDAIIEELKNVIYSKNEIIYCKNAIIEELKRKLQ